MFSIAASIALGYVTMSMIRMRNRHRKVPCDHPRDVLYIFFCGVFDFFEAGAELLVHGLDAVVTLSRERVVLWPGREQPVHAANRLCSVVRGVGGRDSTETLDTSAPYLRLY